MNVHFLRIFSHEIGPCPDLAKSGKWVVYILDKGFSSPESANYLSPHVRVVETGLCSGYANILKLGKIGLPPIGQWATRIESIRFSLRVLTVHIMDVW